LCFFGGGQSTCLALALVMWRLLWLVASCVFVVFCHGIAHSSVAFFGAICVPQHYFMCHGIELFDAAQFSVPWGCFCAMVLCFVLWQCDWCHSIYALCHGIAQCAMPLCDVFFDMALCFMMWQFFCAMALHSVPWLCVLPLCSGAVFVPWHCVMCRGIALRDVLQHLVACCSIAWCVAALRGVPKQGFLCGGTAIHVTALLFWCHSIVPCAFFVSWHCGWCRGTVHGCHGAVHHAACCTWCHIILVPVTAVVIFLQ